MYYGRPGTWAEYEFRVRCVFDDGVGKWSETVVMKVIPFSWKECPDDVDKDRKYSVDENNPRIATKVGDDGDCNIIGNTPLPLNKVTSWIIKILKSKDNDGYAIYIGVASFCIDQNEDNFKECGWYFYCYGSTLWSGPPHNYNGNNYGPSNEKIGEYVHTGDSVGVVMDAIKAELSFIVNGVNLGVAYEGIPLDKPLVPCVILGRKNDSVELDTSETKENDVDRTISVPSIISTNSITWDSITLIWDAVEGTSFYQIEVDGNKSWDVTKTNLFINKELLSCTEYTFRVRALRGNGVSEWSEFVKGRTPEKLFEYSRWKECPDYVDKNHKYLIDEINSRIVAKVDDYFDYCTFIGNTPLPLNKVTSWNIKILKSKNDDGDDIYIGIAPFDINQNKGDNFKKCGWYFYCSDSTLFSGPPHNYGWKLKEYGPRKERGEYVHTGDSIGVVMDTLKGELSFVLNEVNQGAAFEGIPLINLLFLVLFLRIKTILLNLIL